MTSTTSPAPQSARERSVLQTVPALRGGGSVGPETTLAELDTLLSRYSRTVVVCRGAGWQAMIHDGTKLTKGSVSADICGAINGALERVRS